MARRRFAALQPYMSAAGPAPHKLRSAGPADCLFSGIAAGQTPATRVLESPRTVAFRDISPQAPVHVLVIPRQHVHAHVLGGGPLAWPPG